MKKVIIDSKEVYLEKDFKYGWVEVKKSTHNLIRFLQGTDVKINNNKELDEIFSFLEKYTDISCNSKNDFYRNIGQYPYISISEGYLEYDYKTEGSIPFCLLSFNIERDSKKNVTSYVTKDIIQEIEEPYSKHTNCSLKSNLYYYNHYSRVALRPPYNGVIEILE